MENDYQVASISEDCVSEINELQKQIVKLEAKADQQKD